jgi:hypothetical protein
MLSTVTTHYLNNGTHQSPSVSMKCMQQSSLQTAGKSLRRRRESTIEQPPMSSVTILHLATTLVSLVFVLTQLAE